MPTPHEWYQRAQETLRRDREQEAPRSPVSELSLEELLEASALLQARLDRGQQS